MREERAEGGSMTTVMVNERVGRFRLVNAMQAVFVFVFFLSIKYEIICWRKDDQAKPLFKCGLERRSAV